MCSEHGCGCMYPVQECFLSAISVLWSRAGPFPTCPPWLFAPSQESIAMAASAHPAPWANGSTAQKNWGLCLWQSSNRNCRNQQISHFLTKLSLCFRNSWPRLCSQTLQARGGEDPAQTVRGNVGSSGCCQQGDTGGVFHWKATPTEIKEYQKKNHCSWIHIYNSFCIFN